MFNFISISAKYNTAPCTASASKCRHHKTTSSIAKTIEKCSTRSSTTDFGSKHSSKKSLHSVGFLISWARKFNRNFLLFILQQSQMATTVHIPAPPPPPPPPPLSTLPSLANQSPTSYTPAAPTPAAGNLF